MSDTTKTDPDAATDRAHALVVEVARSGGHGRPNQIARLAMTIRASAVDDLDERAFAVLLAMAAGGHVSVATLADCIAAARAAGAALAVEATS